MGRSLALLALGLVAAFFLFQFGGSAGVEAVDPCPTDPIDAKAPCYVVNATADLPDRDLTDPKCEVEPGGSNKCTLRAAIQQANFETKSECSPCTIQFDPLIFPPGPPGGPQTIPIDEDDTEGLLPAIQVPLTIDAVGAGVILEPSIAANGGTGLLEYGLMVLDDTPANPTDFALYGNDFTIRGFIDPHGPVVDANGDGIYICGDSRQDFFAPTGAGPYDATVDDCDEAGPIENVHIENVTIALNGSEGVHIESDGASNITFDTLAIFGNGSESTDGKGISIEAGTANPVTGYLQNSSVHSVGDAIEVEGEKCLFDVVFNPLLTGLDAGVDMDCADGSVIHIDDNGPITGKEGHGVDVEVGDGSIVTVNRNGNIHGGDQKNAVDVGSGIGLTLEIIGNGHLQGGGLGISVTGDSGADITITDNGPAGSIRGDTEEAIELGGLGDGSSARIANNGTLTGGNSSPAITAEGDDDLVVEIDNNRTIEGGDRTIEVKGGDDVFVDITNNWDIINNRGTAIYILSMGDQTVLIEKNGDIIGSDKAIETEAFVGGNNILDVFFNGDIIGYDNYGIVVTTRGDSWVNVSENGATQVAGAAGDEYAPGSIVGGNYGIYVDVDEDSFLWVERNGDVIGHDDDAVYHSVGGDAEGYLRDNGHFVGGAYGIYQTVSEDALLVIEDNGRIEGWEESAVYQSVSGDGELIIRRNGAGGTIEGGDDAIFQDVSGDATLIVEDNGDIIAYDDTAIEQDSDGNADNEIRRNGNIIGATDGVYLDVGGNNDLVLEDNGRIEGWSAEAVYAGVGGNNDAFIGRNGDILGGDWGFDFGTGEDSTVVVEDNGHIIGFDRYGVESDVTGDDELTLLRNGDIIGGDYGIATSIGENAFLLVKDNGDIEGWAFNAFDISVGGDSELIVQRNGLAGSIKGGDDGFEISVGGNQTTLIEENGDIIGFDSYGIYQEIAGDLDSLIQNNNDILGGDRGIFDMADGATDEAILNNDDIIGYSTAGIYFTLATDVDIEIGFNGGTGVAGAAGGFFPRGAIIGGNHGIFVAFGCGDDADIYIHNNGSIIGQEHDGLHVDCGDSLELTVDKNLDIHGGEGDEGLDIVAGVSAIVRISNNNDLVGGEDGADIDLGDSAQLYVENNGPDGSITGGDGDGLDIVVGDDSRIDVINNGNVHGGGRDGINIDGGDSIVANLLDNADITGVNDGIELDATTLEFHIERNDDIKGDSEDGIVAEDAGGELDIIEGTIIDNGQINGHGRDGIRLIGEGMPAGAPSRLQNVTISGNIIGNGSEDRGIYLECLKDANDCIGFGNVIADNLIVGNGEEGVFLRGDFDEAFTLNTVGPDNVIMRNGGPGVRITDSSDNTIVGNHIIENGGVGFDIPRSGIDISEAVGEADRNTITKNSFWSNIGLGIDLQGDGLGCPGLGDDPNDCIETPPRPDVDGNSISGRIGPPEGVGLCAFCTVEAFVVHNPADPTGFGEGATYIGRAQTDGTGDYKIDVGEFCGVKAGAVTVTLTDEDGNTSEFSRNTGGFDGTNECAPTATPTHSVATPLPPTITNTPVPMTPTDTPVVPTATDTPVPPTAANTAEPPTATRTATDVPPDNCGDVNNDGVVDSEDALAILQAKAGFTDGVPKPSAADVDGDGEMTSQDALIILQVAAGFIDRSDLNCP